MPPRNLTLILSYSLTAVVAVAVSRVPAVAVNAALLGVSMAVGIWWDLGRRPAIPRLLFTAAGLVGFFIALLPLRRETLTEQALAALSILTCVKLLQAKGDRDHLQLLALSLIMVAGSASLSLDFIFGLLFAVELALSIALLFWLPMATALGAGAAPKDILKRLAAFAGLTLVAAVPLAILTFALLPRALNPFWMGLTVKPSATTGFSDTLELGLVGKISVSPEVAFRVDMGDGRGPLPSVPYWRGLVLEVTDGRIWSTAPPRFSGGLAGGGANGLRLTYYLEPHGARELFVLEQAVAVNSGFRSLALNQGGTARLPAPLFKPLRYQALSDPSGAVYRRPLPDEIPLNLRLPEGFSPRLAALASDLAGDGDAESIVERMLAYFSRGFTYSLAVPSSPGDPLESFVFNHRTGYCEYFASALAHLLRAAGVPARVVIGYLGGDFNAADNYYLVRQAGAHAWVEAALPGKGWSRLDPTPAAAEIGQTLAATRAGRPRLWLDALRMRWNSWLVQYDTEVQVALMRRTRKGFNEFWRFRSNWSWTAWLGLAVIAAAVLIFAFGRRRSATDPIEGFYARLTRLLRRAGQQRRAAEGPIDFARRAAAAWPSAADPIVAFMHLYADIRYGGTPADKEALALLSEHLSAIAGSPPPKADPSSGSG